MNKDFPVQLKKNHVLSWLFLGMLIYKFSMDLGYLYLNGMIPKTYPLSFHPLKYAVGLLWCIVLFLCIRHTEQRASSFFLYFTFLFQIVPISTVYALKDERSAYYHVLCLGFLLCELLVGYVSERPLFRRNFPVSRIMTFSFAAAAVLLVIYLVRKNGAPHLSLLDIRTVYEYRRGGELQISKYMNYLLNWTTTAFLPLGMAWALTKRRYPAAALLGGGQLLLYLYTGAKILLFSIPLILVGTLWSRRKNFYQELFLTGCAGFSVLTLLACLTRPGSLWYSAFSLLVRRSMLLPARLKFDYFDYFSSHPKMGIYAIFPRWIIPVSSYYEKVSSQHEIGAIYYGAPEMNANTGFFAEGYMRFGHIGTVLILVLFALLLKQTDRLQERAGYQLAVGVFLFPVFSLVNSQLLSSLVFGAWMSLEAILLFYTLRPSKSSNPLKEASLEHPSELPDTL